jgi:hypothetical protein
MGVVIHGSDDSGPVKLVYPTTNGLPSGSTYIAIPFVTTEEREAMTMVENTMVYDTDLSCYCGVVNASGTLGWWGYSWVDPLF